MRRAAVLACFVAAACVARRAKAYRPFDGTDGDVAATGEIELEIGPVGYLKEEGARSLIAPAFIFNWGFARRFEMVIAAKNAVVFASDLRPRDQLLDPELNIKWLVREGCLQDRVGPSVAVETGMLMAASDERGAGAHLAMISSLRWAALAAHLNLEAAYRRDHRGGFVAGLILEGPAAWRARPVAELLVERAGSATRGSTLLGTIAPASETLAFDAAVRLGYGEGLEGELRLGLTWTFSTGETHDAQSSSGAGGSRPPRLLAPFAGPAALAGGSFFGGF